MKSHKLLNGILLVAAVAMIFTACNTGSHKGFKKTSSGIYYKIKTENNTDTSKIRVGKIIFLDMKYGLKDSTFFDSKTRPGEMRFPVAESTYEGDFYEALQLFHQGDSGTFILQAEPFFKKTVNQPTLPPGIEPDDEIIFDLYVKQVQTQAELEAEEAARNETLKQEEPAKIASFIQENNITVEPDTAGVYYIETLKGKGKSPKTDDYAKIHFTVSLVGGERLFSSLDSGEPLEFKVGSGFENVGFQSAVRKMKVGGKANALVPSAKAFGAAGMGAIVPPYSAMYYEIELLDVYSQEEFDKRQLEKENQKKAEEFKLQQQEVDNLKTYLKENNITTPASSSGLIYIETLAGTGPAAVKGKKVKVHYTGTLLDGTKFDSSLDRGQPFEFTLGQGQVIMGWDEGIALMRQGGKAKLIIPSTIGYGARAQGNVIPAYATLVFDVELVEVSE